MLVEVKQASWSVRLDVVDLMNTAVEAKLDLVGAVHFIEYKAQLACVLAQTVVAIGISARVLPVVALGKILTDVNGRHAGKSTVVKVGRKAELRKRICNAMRIVGIDVPHAAREAQRRIQQ